MKLRLASVRGEGREGGEENPLGTVSDGLTVPVQTSSLDPSHVLLADTGLPKHSLIWRPDRLSSDSGGASRGRDPHIQTHTSVA